MTNTQFNTNIGRLNIFPQASYLIIRADHLTKKETQQFKREWLKVMKENGPLLIVNSETS